MFSTAADELEKELWDKANDPYEEPECRAEALRRLDEITAYWARQESLDYAFDNSRFNV